MKNLPKFLLVLCLTLGGSALAQSLPDAPGTVARYYEPTALLTRAAPDNSATNATITEGMPLIEGGFYRVTVCAADNAKTLSGAGTLQAYVWSNFLQTWSRNPSLDIPITVTATSCQGAACTCQTSVDYEVGVASGRVLYAPTGVTVSAGTTVRVLLLSWLKRGIGR